MGIFRALTHLTSKYYCLFSFLEERNLLDINDDLHLHVLHIVFIPRINNSLQLFTEGWDSHPLRTAGNDSPNKLWLRGQLTYTPDGNDGSEDARATMDDLYGVDSDGPPVPDDDTNTVVVIPPNSPLSENQVVELNTRVDVLAHSQSYGIDLYLEALDIARNMILV